MQRYIIRRCLFALLILALFSVLAFFMVRLLPGDPIRAAMQQNVDLTDESIVQEVRAQYGLDKPVPVQYYIWLRDFFRADWGTSLGSGDEVWDMFWRRLPVTLELFFGATFWSFLFGFPLGIFSALAFTCASRAARSDVYGQGTHVLQPGGNLRVRRSWLCQCHCASRNNFANYKGWAVHMKTCLFFAGKIGKIDYRFWECRIIAYAFPSN